MQQIMSLYHSPEGESAYKQTDLTQHSMIFVVCLLHGMLLFCSTTLAVAANHVSHEPDK